MVEVSRTSQHDGLGSVSTTVETDCHDPSLAARESFSDVAYRGLGFVFWQRWKCFRLWDLHSGLQEDLQGRQPSMDLIIQVNEPSVREVQSGRDLSLAEGCDLSSHVTIYAGRWRSYGDLRSHLEGMVDEPLFGYTGFVEREGPSTEVTSSVVFTVRWRFFFFTKRAELHHCSGIVTGRTMVIGRWVR
ncbi:hypothetical protein NE237_001725 [Protea cynaroides]|uniref:Uncharacterized protein n=1 Tax=Protea cynaroides TaxID=273540 RepID=A0A9Q0QYQ6_9MAGN|nr:hypothetical protein NE237_001725 [Protea cynaroides]